MIDFYRTILSFIITAALLTAAFRQAGYSGWLGLLMLIPVVNFLVLAVFSFREWPVTRELARLRVAAGEGDQEDCYRVLSTAQALARD